MPLKIYLLGTAYPFRGGLAAYNERLMQEFQAMGQEVKIYTFTLQYPSFLFPGKTQLSDDPAPEGLPIEAALSSINPLNWLRLGRRIWREKPDLLLIKFWLPFMGPAFGTVARLAKRNGHTRVISIIDNIIPHEKRPFDHAFARYFANACDAFITMSRAVKEEMKDFVKGQPVVYEPHPIYDNYGALISKAEARAYLGLGEGEKVILFFGFVRKYKGLDLLIEAMNDPRIRQAGIRLVVAGEYYGDKAEYDALIAQYGLQQQITSQADFISNEAVKYYFCAADVVVQPYKTATQSGISQMAYHFEKPMIVTQVGGLPEIVPDGRCGYVTEVSSEAIAQAIVDFYALGKEQEFVEGVRSEKQRYSWRNMAQVILGLKKG